MIPVIFMKRSYMGETLMSKRFNNGSHYENHQRAAELHDLAAHADRAAEVQHGKEDHESGQEHSRAGAGALGRSFRA